MKVPCAAQVRVIDDGRRLPLSHRSVEVVGDDRSDALVGEGPDGRRPGRHGLGPGRGEAAVQAHDAQAGAEALLGMGAPVQDGDDEALGCGADLPAPALEAGRRPFGITAVGARHVLGIGAVPGAAVAPIMGGDALAAVEHLDGAGREAHVDLLADQGVGHRVQEARGLDVIVEVDPRQPPLGEDVRGCRQRQQGRPLHGLEQGPAGGAEAAHEVGVDALHHGGDGGVALGQGEERLPAQAPQDVALGEADAVLHLGLIARLARTGRQDADAVVVGHHAVGAVDLRIVERRLVDPALQVVGHHEARHAAQEAEQAHVGADPVRQRLGPRRLGVGEAGGTQHGHEDLRLRHHACGGIDDGHALAGIVDEHLVTSGVVLAHHRGETSLELPVKIAEARVTVAIRLLVPVLVPEDHKVDPWATHLADHRRPVGFDPSSDTLLHADMAEQALLENSVGDLFAERPDQARCGHPAEVVLDGGSRDAEGSADLAGAHPIAGEPEHVSDLSHRQLSPGRHPVLLACDEAGCRGC
nr:hypothetical protein CFP56_78537 [Quercus suber]